MKKKIRLTISKKILLLTAVLSLALIAVSVTVPSVVFNVRIRDEAKALCSASAESLSDYLSDYEMPVDTASTMENFLVYYKGRLDEVYLENRAEIETMSGAPTDTAEEYAAKRSFFKELTANLFGAQSGFGMSFASASLSNNYAEVTEEMERMASVEGMICCDVFYYDPANGNLVQLCDSLPETDPDYSFPGSVEKPTDFFRDTVLKTGELSVTSFEDSFVAYAPVRVKGETVAYCSFSYSIDRLVDSLKSFVGTLILIMLAATAAILVIYLILANRWLAGNIRKLSESARTFTSRMAEGELSPVRPDIRTRDEISDLSDDFVALEDKVVSYADDIARKQAADQRMQAELGIASKIQMQSLPNEPLISGDVRISSYIKPAKEVGGDLFDYFRTDNGKLFFVIADVSGKGIPAALFMMRGKEIIRSCAKAGMSAADIAQTANRELCRNNREGLFITAFIGIYDEKEKVLTYCRAGHEQPFLLRDGRAEQFGEESNFVLGVFDSMPFLEDRLDVLPGDRILLFTDGLNEGINEKSEAFGYERIADVTEKADGDLIAALAAEASSFAGKAEQFDDITMLLFECLPNLSFSLKPPTFDDIPAVTDRINGLLQGLDPDRIGELDVVIDELMNNPISYGFESVKKPCLEIEARRIGTAAELTFTDNGMLFDPLSQTDPDVESDLKDRPAGGMGIYLAKTMTDRITYRVFEGKNRLTVRKDLTPKP